MAKTSALSSRPVDNHVTSDVTGPVVQADTITGDVVFQGVPGADFGLGLVSVVPPTFRLDGTLHGRADLIRQLIRAARAQRGAHVVMHGLGGSGKTTAALAFADRMAHEHRDIRVWWLDASAEKTLRAGFREVALEAGGPIEQVIKAWSGHLSAAQVLGSALARATGPWVIVIDNADDRRLLEPWWQPLAQATGAVLITTRDGGPTSWRDDAEMHEVGPLDEEQAVALLRALAPDAGTVKQARDLAGTLAHLPLTLHLAGRYLDAAKSFPPVPGVDLPQDFDSYRLVFRSDFGTLDELHELNRALGPRELLTRTWEFTLDLLHEIGHPLARALVRWLSCFAQAPIPYTLVDWRVVAQSPLFADATGTSVLRTLLALEQFGLTKKAPFRHVHSSSVTTDSLQLHPVIREANRTQADFQHDLRSYVALALAVLDGFTSELSGDVPEDLSRWAALSPHCEHVVDWIHRRQDVFGEDWALLATKLTCTVARFAQVTDDYPRAESLFEHALVVRVSLLGENHPEVLGLRREVACLHWNSLPTNDVHRFRQCVDEYEELARKCHDVLGEEDPLTLACRFELALIKSYDDEAPSVAEHYREVVRLGRQVFGRVEGTAFTTQLSLVGHLWRRMDWSGAADFSLEEELSRLIAMIDELDADESTRGELPLPADELRARFTGMLEACASWNARVSAAGAQAGIGSTGPELSGYVPTVHHGEFRDPRLVQVYDVQCPWSVDDDFFLSVADETPDAHVLDLGCGTGRLALGLARAGHVVTGVDPAPASLAAARTKPDADRVTWLEGTAEDLPDAAFDVVVMTGHVAQFFVTDEEWTRALADLRRVLVPGGRLVFDTRDPRARRWERWNPVESREHVVLPDGVDVVIQSEVTALEGSAVTVVHHYTFSDGDRRRSKATLRFRGEAEVRSALADAGFEVEHVYGGWRREPVGAPDGELLVVARAQV